MDNHTIPATMTAFVLAGLSLGLPGATAARAAEPPSPPSAAAGTADASDIIVTAQRREQRLQDVPISITVLDAAQLRSQQITSTQALVTTAPGAINYITRGDPTTLLVSLRGVPSPTPSILQDPSVGVYVDGVYIARTMGQGIGLVDMQRTEILSGPQGTLFGRNTIGGALNLTTQRPTGEFGGSASVSYGNYNTLNGQAVLNLPIDDDRLAARFVYSHQQHDGYVFNENLGQHMNGLNTEYARASLSFRPDPSWDFSLSGEYGTNNASGQGVKLLYVSPTSPFAAIYPGFAGFVGGDMHTVNAFENLRVKLRSKGLAFNASKELGDITIKSITGYRTLKTSSPQDIVGVPFPAANETKTALHDYHQFSEELQIIGDTLGGRLNYIIGGYYFEESGWDGYNLQAFGGLPFSPPIQDIEFRGKNRSVGAFGQVTYKITPLLELTGGVRYTRDTRAITRSLKLYDVPDGTFLGCGLPDGIVTDPVNCIGGPVSKSVGFVPWTVSLSFKPSRNALFYAKASRGYRSGGFPPGSTDNLLFYQPFGPEKLTSYEIGAKGELLDRHLLVNAAGYYSDYRQIQQQRVVDGGAAGPQQYVGNFGNARIWGAELGLTAVIDQLRFGGNFGLIDAKYTKGDLSTGSTLGTGIIPNTPYQLTPKFTAALTADYHVPIVSGGSLNLHADYTYRSNVYYSALSVSDVESHRFERQDGYGLLNALVSFKPNSIPATFSIWGKNLTNKDYASAIADLVSAGLGTVSAYVGDPRTYGITIGYDF